MSELTQHRRAVTSIMRIELTRRLTAAGDLLASRRTVAAALTWCAGVNDVGCSGIAAAADIL